MWGFFLQTMDCADTYKPAIRFCSSSLWIHARSPPMALQKSLAPNHVCIFSLPPWKIYKKWTTKYCAGYFWNLETAFWASIFLLVSWCLVLSLFNCATISLWSSIKFYCCNFAFPIISESLWLQTSVQPTYCTFQHFPDTPAGEGWRRVTTDYLSSRQGEIHLPCVHKTYSHLKWQAFAFRSQTPTLKQKLLWGMDCHPSGHDGRGVVGGGGGVTPSTSCLQRNMFVSSQFRISHNPAEVPVTMATQPDSLPSWNIKFLNLIDL